MKSFNEVIKTVLVKPPSLKKDGNMTFLFYPAVFTQVDKNDFYKILSQVKYLLSAHYVIYV